MVGCYGTTEYTEDMTSLRLGIKYGANETGIDYEYKCRTQRYDGADEVYCTVPPIKTLVSMRCTGRKKTGYISEGYAFSPMFTLGYETQLKEEESETTWLRLERAN